jgi:hypothetical protein
LPRRHAQRAVQADRLAVQVRVGDDVRGQLGELRRPAQARRERDRRGQRLLHGLGQLLHQRRLEQARRDRADADAVLREVARQRQRHAHEAGLAGRVGLLADLAVERGHRRRQHHHAAFAAFERRLRGDARRRQPNDVVGADEVDADDALEVLQRRRLPVLADDAPGGADAGDVHDDARGAVRRLGALDGVRDAGAVGDVGDEGAAADLRGHALGAGGVDVEHGHLRALARQLARHRLAEAGAAAGDEGGLSVDLHGPGSFQSFFWAPR